MSAPELIRKCFELLSEKDEIETFRLLHEEFPQIPKETINAVIKRTEAYLRLACELADSVRNDELDVKEAARRLASNFQDFPEDLNGRAIGYGLSVTR